MNDKPTQTTPAVNPPAPPADQTLVVGAGAGAESSSASSASAGNVTVIINNPVQRSNGGGGRRSSAPAPRADSAGAPAAAPVAPQTAQTSATHVQASPAAAPDATGVTPGVRHRPDNDTGQERHTLTDRDGDRVVIVRDADTNVRSVTFKDARVEFSTSSDASGFSGTRIVPNGSYGGTDRVEMAVTPGYFFNSGTIYCSDDARLFDPFDTRFANNGFVDNLTVHELQSYLLRNPELAAELRRMDVPLVEVAGRDLTAAELGRFRPTHQACPTGRDDDYTARIPPR